MMGGEEEYALLIKGEIVNVVTTTGGRTSAERAARLMDGDVTVALLDSLPEDVKKRYRYWDERP